MTFIQHQKTILKHYLYHHLGMHSCRFTPQEGISKYIATKSK